MKPDDVYFVYKNKRFVRTVPSLPLTKYSLFYHPGYDLLGLDVGQGVVRIDNERVYMAKTTDWQYIGEI
jgi:hypothetical protein